MKNIYKALCFVVLATVMYGFNVNLIKHYLQDVKPIAIATGNFVAIVIPAFSVLAFSGFFTAQTFEKIKIGSIAIEDNSSDYVPPPLVPTTAKKFIKPLLVSAQTGGIWWRVN